MIGEAQIKTAPVSQNSRKTTVTYFFFSCSFFFFGGGGGCWSIMTQCRERQFDAIFLQGFFLPAYMYIVVVPGNAGHCAPFEGGEILHPFAIYKWAILAVSELEGKQVIFKLRPSKGYSASCIINMELSWCNAADIYYFILL